jgi:hypothetical protein
VQDQVADPVGGDGAAQQTARPEDLLLPLELIQAAGAQPIRERCQAAAQLIAAVAEQIRQSAPRQRACDQPHHPMEKPGQGRYLAACCS